MMGTRTGLGGLCPSKATVCRGPTIWLSEETGPKLDKLTLQGAGNGIPPLRSGALSNAGDQRSFNG